MPDDRQRPGESWEERNQRLRREWEEHYGTEGLEEELADAQAREIPRSVNIFSVIIYLGLIVGTYVMTRMLDFILPGANSRPRLPARVMSVITLVVTAIGLIDICVQIVRSSH